MTRRTWTDEQLIAAVAKSETMGAVLRDLGLRLTGANRPSVRRHIDRLGLSTEHFTGRPQRAGRKGTRSLDEYLASDGPHIQPARLLRLLQNAGLKNDACERCQLVEWQGGPIPLELDHVDGNPANNLPCNLRALCPNCHALTPTYCGRNSPTKRRCECGAYKAPASTWCRSCGIANRAPVGRPQPTKIEWPAVEQLQKMVAASSYCAVGRLLGVSDNAVRKHSQFRSGVV